MKNSLISAPPSGAHECNWCLELDMAFDLSHLAETSPWVEACFALVRIQSSVLKTH